MSPVELSAQQIEASVQPATATFASIRDAKRAWRRLSVLTLGSAAGLILFGSGLPGLGPLAMLGAAIGLGTLGVQAPFTLLFQARQRALFRAVRDELPWLTLRDVERANMAYQLSVTALESDRRRRTLEQRRRLLDQTVRRSLTREA